MPVSLSLELSCSNSTAAAATNNNNKITTGIGALSGSTTCLNSVGENDCSSTMYTASLRRVILDNGSIRLIIGVPSDSVFDGEQANHTAALLFDQLDQLNETAAANSDASAGGSPESSTSGDVVLERVKVSNVKFTKEGVEGLAGFLSARTDEIRHVSLKDMGNDPEAFLELCTIFQRSKKLETLNLSDNVIPSIVWQKWGQHTKLRQLILDYVKMDDDSIEQLEQHFTFGETLEELYMVLTNCMGGRGLASANRIVSMCTMASSLRWAVKDAPPDAKLPWQGLTMLSSKSKTNLLHLTMDGGTTTNEEYQHLCSALADFTALKTIKFRSIGMQDEACRMIVDVLLQPSSHPQIESIDWSRNSIRGDSDCNKLTELKTLTLLSLDRNTIEAGGARTLLESFGRSAGLANSKKIDIKLDGNPFHYGKVAYNLACRKGQAETVRDELLNENERLRASLQDNSEAIKLKEEITKLREEKAALLRAFAIVGTNIRDDDHAKLHNRVCALEEKVLGSAQSNTKSVDRHGTPPFSGNRANTRSMSATNTQQRRASLSSSPSTMSSPEAQSRRSSHNNIFNLQEIEQKLSSPGKRPSNYDSPGRGRLTGRGVLSSSPKRSLHDLINPVSLMYDGNNSVSTSHTWNASPRSSPVKTKLSLSQAMTTNSVCSVSVSGSSTYSPHKPRYSIAEDDKQVFSSLRSFGSCSNTNTSDYTDSTVKLGQIAISEKSSSSLLFTSSGGSGSGSWRGRMNVHDNV